MHMLLYLVRRAVGKSIKYQAHPVKTQSKIVFGLYMGYLFSTAGWGQGKD